MLKKLNCLSTDFWEISTEFCSYSMSLKGGCCSGGHGPGSATFFVPVEIGKLMGGGKSQQLRSYESGWYWNVARLPNSNVRLLVVANWPCT
jgi:hypothetical protein